MIWRPLEMSEQDRAFLRLRRWIERRILLEVLR